MRHRIIKKYGIKYIIFSSDENPILKFDPDKSAYLEKVFDKTIRIYRVKL